MHHPEEGSTEGTECGRSSQGYTRCSLAALALICSRIWGSEQAKVGRPSLCSFLDPLTHLDKLAPGEAAMQAIRQRQKQAPHRILLAQGDRVVAQGDGPGSFLLNSGFSCSCMCWGCLWKQKCMSECSEQDRQDGKVRKKGMTQADRSGSLGEATVQHCSRAMSGCLTCTLKSSHRQWQTASVVAKVARH